MRFYFQLRLRMLQRQLVDFGLNPLLGIVLITLGFIGMAFYLFSKTEFAPFIFTGIGASFLLQLSSNSRNSALKSYFSRSAYYKLRLLENAILGLPFLLVLLITQSFLPALGFFALAIGMAFFNFEGQLNITIPTPFSKRPFEFAVGFRRTFPLIFLAYFLTSMGVVADNFNLAVFSQVMLIAVGMSFYGKPEDPFYVWTYARSPKEFLFEKIQTALLHCTMLSIPAIVLMLIFFPSLTLLTIAFQLLGMLYLVTILLAKYSAFPQQINLPQSVILAVSFLFLPALPVFTAYFYNQAKDRLNTLLDAQN